MVATTARSASTLTTCPSRTPSSSSIPENGGPGPKISEDDYVEGAPELVVEVAYSSVSYDLHAKLHVYRRNEASGIRRLAGRGRDDRLVHRLREGRYERLPLYGGWPITEARSSPDSGSILKALIRGDMAAVFGVIQARASPVPRACRVRRSTPKAAILEGRVSPTVSEDGEIVNLMATSPTGSRRTLRRPDFDRKLSPASIATSPARMTCGSSSTGSSADSIERHALRDTSVELGGILLGKECIDEETGIALRLDHRGPRSEALREHAGKFYVHA